MHCSGAISEYRRLLAETNDKCVLAAASRWLEQMSRECPDEWELASRPDVFAYYKLLCEKNPTWKALHDKILATQADDYYTITGLKPRPDYVPYSIRTGPDLRPTTTLEAGKTYRIQCSPTYRVLAMLASCKDSSPCNAALKHWGHETGRWTLTEPFATPAGTFYRFQNRATGRYLDAADGTAKGDLVRVRDRNAGDARVQVWGPVRHGHTDLFRITFLPKPKVWVTLDAESTQVQNEDCKVQAWPPPLSGPSSNQLWRFYPSPDFAEMPGNPLKMAATYSYVAPHYELSGEAVADAPAAMGWTTWFKMIAITPYTVALLSATGRYVHRGSDGVLYVNATHISGASEKFRIDPPVRENGKDVFPPQFKLQSTVDDKYVCLDAQKRLVAACGKDSAQTFASHWP